MTVVRRSTAIEDAEAKAFPGSPTATAGRHGSRGRAPPDGTAARSLDDLVRKVEQHRRHLEPDRLCGSQIDDEFEFGRLAARRSIALPVGRARALLAPEDRDVCGLGSAENFDELPGDPDKAWAGAGKTARLCGRSAARR